MSEKYLITGATGFVGANIVRRLLKEKKEVHILARNKNLNWRLSDLSNALKIHNMDILDSSLPNLFKKINPTYIFHLAAYGSLPHESDTSKLIDINLRGTINVINSAKKCDFKLLINTGSSSEYGVKFTKMTESDLPFPVNDYGVVKTASSLYVHKEAVRNNLPMITFRLFSAYGPYEHKPRFIPTVIRKAIKGESINVGNKKNVRDFIYIEDMVDAYLNSCRVKIKPGEIYNIGTGTEATLERVVNLIVKLAHSKSEIHWGVISAQERQVEQGKWQANITKTSRDLGWKATYNLKGGLEKTIKWFRSYDYLYE